MKKEDKEYIDYHVYEQLYGKGGGSGGGGGCLSCLIIPIVLYVIIRVLAG